MSVTTEWALDRTHPFPVPRAEAHVCAPPLPGRRLCRPCLARGRTILRALPPLYDDCLHALNPVRRGPIVEKVSGTRPAHSPNDAAVEARTKTQAVLASWAHLVSDERGLTTRGGDVGHLARFLTAHLDWLAAHPGAADFVAEIDELLRGVMRAVDAGPASESELGPCVESGCDGVLLARGAAGRGGGAPQVRCDTGRHAWRPDQWLLLRRRLDDPGRA
ncbi:MAG TPA: hypothetical protein VFU43_16350 [Streptosporangiaceae bacterium]|nr:hypothetical protein [Streptosporangiaceae bacterium]